MTRAQTNGQLTPTAFDTKYVQGEGTSNFQKIKVPGFNHDPQQTKQDDYSDGNNRQSKPPGPHPEEARRNGPTRIIPKEYKSACDSKGEVGEQGFLRAKYARFLESPDPI